ncbi:uncharacterized protein [Branchiostoma lanceolatum]|uniref:uncharacterized protein n=1 Tax=Branchiostoma lanceolatum TaxID=7740 RepID=UPI0034563E76
MAVIWGDGWLFGGCDYFTVEEREMFVRTEFCCLCFLPCVPEKSILLVADGQGIDLPEVVDRSVGWAWLRNLSWVIFLTLTCVGALFLAADDHTQDQWPWALIALAVVFLGLAIFVTVYKPKASEESKQKYLNMVEQAVARFYLEEQMATEAPDDGSPAPEDVAIARPPTYQGLDKDNAF